MTAIPANIRRNKDKATGYRCPTCQEFAHIIDSRRHHSGWRRRRCCKNNHRFTTFEGEVNQSADFVEMLANLQADLETTERSLQLRRQRLSELIRLAQAAREIEEGRFGDAGPLKPATSDLCIAQDGEVYPAGPSEQAEIPPQYGWVIGSL